MDLLKRRGPRSPPGTASYGGACDKQVRGLGDCNKEKKTRLSHNRNLSGYFNYLVFNISLIKITVINVASTFRHDKVAAAISPKSCLR